MENKIQIVPVTVNMVKDFYGHIPKRTFKAFAMVKNEKIIGVGGIYIDDDHIVVFSDLTDEARRNKLSLLKATYKVMNLVHSSLPVYALCDPNVKKSGKLLKHIGFLPLDERTYQWAR